jgi:serine/threonine protein kinase
MKDNIVIKNLTFENLIPIREGFKNKNNKFSAKGNYKDIKVKVYEAFDKDQGALREFVFKHKELTKFFPKLIAYDEKYIVEEWLDGKTLREDKPNYFKNLEYAREVKKIIKLMWSINYDKKVFDYIDYIYRRLGKSINFDVSKIPIKLNHNDLSLDNILITSEGLKIIDNEFLGCNTGWVLNIKNSFIKDDFLYENFISKKDLAELWNIRAEWSHN